MFLTYMQRLMLYTAFITPLYLASAYAEEETGSLSYIDTRLNLERQSDTNNFAILPYKPNYILPFSYNSQPNHAPWLGFGLGQAPVKNTEIKFQLSIKIPLAYDLFTEGDALFVGYTQKSFWQAYSKAISSPFRDTNYNPDIFYRMRLNENILGLHTRILTLGLEHESNGRAGSLSRSWNRLYSTVVADRGKLTLGAKLWYRIPENIATDDNPTIHRYLGYGELYGYYKHRDHVLGMMLRPSFGASFAKSGLQLDWSFPLLKNLQGYAQYYHGYGESLLDYNHSNNRFSVGVMINNWL